MLHASACVSHRTVISYTSVWWSGSSFQGSSLPQDAIFVCVCVNSLQAWGGVCCARDGEKRLYFGGHIGPLPSAQDFFFSSYDLISFSFFFMYYVFHVLSAFYGIKCLCQEGGRINPMDFAALKTVSVGF